MKLKVLIFACVMLAGCSKEVAPPMPVADFEYSEQNNGLILFKHTSKNATSYRWDLGNGLVNTYSNPEWKYAKNGIYTVTLTAISEHGQDNITRTVRVSTAPTTGSIIFWSNYSAETLIYIEGVYIGKTTKYFPGANGVTPPPPCNTEGSVTYTAPEGTYNYTAKSNELFPLTWKGTITITNGNCRGQLLVK